jgi:CheY-like chemotaxis protein
MLCRSLAKFGFNVDTARNGQEAIHKMQESCYRAVLMDFLMPILDGISATAAVRSFVSLSLSLFADRAHVTGF